jgi:hypothetical protein
MIYQRIAELLNVSSDYIGLTSVDMGIIGGLLLCGITVGTSIGALLGLGLTPRDNRWTHIAQVRLVRFWIICENREIARN